LHDTLDGGVAGAPEVPAALEGLSQLLGHDLGVDVGLLAGLDDLDLGVLDGEAAVEVLPLRPMTIPGRSATMETRVPMGVRWMSMPPKPARSVSLCRYSRIKRRPTASRMNFFSTAIRLPPRPSLG
jgi:hypothetical protein